jgi:hypothetical protein
VTTIREAAAAMAADPVSGIDLTPRTSPCEVCGIDARYLSIAQAWVHTEGRTLANNLHNGTPDHNAVVTS